jgi:anti-sigma B factor antagonist
MEINKKKEDGILIICLNGRLDAVSSPDFDRELGQLVDDGETSIVFDLNELNYISSAGLRSFLIIAKKLKAKSGKIALTSLQDIVKQVFEVSGFNQILPIFNSVDEALSNVK